MRFDIYGQQLLDVAREGGNWKVYEVGTGTRVLLSDVVIPSDVDDNDISTFLDDLFHELARPGKTIRRIS
jgi:hypothetical protein